MRHNLWPPLLLLTPPSRPLRETLGASLAAHLGAAVVAGNVEVPEAHVLGETLEDEHKPRRPQRVAAQLEHLRPRQ